MAFLLPAGPLTFRRTVFTVAALSALLVLTFLLGLSLGSVPIPVSRVLTAVTGGDIPDTDRTILFAIRLPRLLLAVLVGAGLSVAGAVFQALLRNPLAEPYVLGISSGGTVGAITVIGLGIGASHITAPVASFIGSLLVMALVYGIARRRGTLDTYTLLLAGVMIGAFFNAAVLLLVAVFNQEVRHAFLWLMGNLGTARPEAIGVIAPFILLGAAGIFIQSRNYNLISTGDETAMQLGVEVSRVKRVSYFLASLLTGLVVSVSGVVGFVGLIIPHICRMLFGPDHRLLIPAAFLLGGSFLIVADIIARTVIAPSEIPVGAVTAAIGAPLFVYLLRRS